MATPAAADADAECAMPVPEHSKREYLLAQIRQKDAIIESLLKQLHNPYMATPLSIAAYRMASSPSDTHGSRNVIQWLERLQQSAHNQPGAGSAPGTARALERRERRRLRRLGQGAGVEDGAEDSESDADAEELGAEGGGGDSTMAGADDGGGLPGAPKADPEAAAQAVSETLRQCDSLPDDAVPIGLLANLSISNRAGRPATAAAHAAARAASREGSARAAGSAVGESDADDDNNVGVANETYFMPGPATDLGVRKQLIERHSPPEILVHGLVNAEDVERLFEIFYEKVNPFLSLLDPQLHTPASTFARCPFLFTVVCAISSRYYREKSEIYAIAMHFAKHAAATALIDGWKSVELCQAYILMAVYAVPARRWEEDRSWLYIGLAIRLATDLNLHQASGARPADEQHAREVLNRTRVWMICFNLDRSTATQFGKPSTIKEDYIIRNSKDWYRRSPLNHAYDVHLCAYSSLLRIVAQFHEEIFSDKDAPGGLNSNTDFRAVTLRHDAILEEYFKEWTQKFQDDSDPNDKACKFRCTLLPFLTNYSRLVMFSFGFQQAFRRGFRAGDELFFNKCMESASNVIKCVIETLAPSGYFRYAPDGHFVFASFASAFLLKLLRPEFSNLVTREQTSQIFGLIGKLIQVLASSEVSIDDRHTPKLYARFLAGLLAKHQPGGSSSGRLHPGRPSEGQMPDPRRRAARGRWARVAALARVSSTSAPVHRAGARRTAAARHSGGSRAGRTEGGGGVPELVAHQVGAGGLPSPLSMSGASMDTPIYEAEATYAVGTGPLELSSSDAMQFNIGGPLGVGYGGMRDEEMLATMHAIKNPAFWEDMMMPGFMWPDTARNTPFQTNNILGLNGGFIPQQMPLHS
ncbi:fungal-specific transcription factor domain-containing protein [Phellopilus nigrolimitatus]|nr:fungal-specific transcription factor domain-containing protein [Phellopilus nigrolimitatus]